LIIIFRRWLWHLRSFFYFSSTTIRVVALCVCVHLISSVTALVGVGYTGISYSSVLHNCFSLNWPLFSKGFVWQLISHIFMHGSWWHLILNMWACVVFGSVLERDHGARFFLKVFLIGGIIGGAGWLAYTAVLPFLSFMAPLSGWIAEPYRAWLCAGDGLKGSLSDSSCIGASGGVFALLGCFIAMYPKRELYVLLFFVIPLRLRAHTLLWIIVAFTFAEAIFIQSPIANASHLCGGAFGYWLGWRSVRLGRCKV